MGCCESKPIKKKKKRIEQTGQGQVGILEQTSNLPDQPINLDLLRQEHKGHGKERTRPSTSQGHGKERTRPSTSQGHGKERARPSTSQGHGKERKKYNVSYVDTTIGESSSHIKYKGKGGFRRLERFREWYEGKRDSELIPATHIELWRINYIATTPNLLHKAYPLEIYDCLHLVNAWDKAHPSVFKDVTTQTEKDQLVELFDRAMSNYRTYEETQYFHRSITEFKDSAVAYISRYFEIIDLGKLSLTQLEDLGKYKPFSHFHFSEIESRFQTTPEVLMDKYKDDEETKVFIARSALNGEQTLFRYHTKELLKLIQRRRGEVKTAKWPTDPDEFAYNVSQVVVPENDPFRDVIESLYGYTGGGAAIKQYYSIETLIDQIEER